MQNFDERQLLSERELTHNLQNFFLKESVEETHVLFLVAGILLKLISNVNSDFLSKRNVDGLASTSAANMLNSGFKHFASFVGSMCCLIYLYFTILKLYGLFKYKKINNQNNNTDTDFPWKALFQNCYLPLSIFVTAVCVLFLWIMIGVYNSSPQLNEKITCQLVFNNDKQSTLRSLCTCRFNAWMIFEDNFEKCLQHFSKVVSPIKLGLIGVLTGMMIKITNQLFRIFENVTIQISLSFIATLLYFFIICISIETPKDRYQTYYFEIGLNVDNFVFLRFFTRIWHYCFSYFFKLLVTTTQVIGLVRSFFDIGSDNSHKMVEFWTDVLVAFLGSVNDPFVLIIYFLGFLLKYLYIRWRYSRNEKQVVNYRRDTLREINPFEMFERKDFHCFFFLMMLLTAAHAAACVLYLFILKPTGFYVVIGFEVVMVVVLVGCMVWKSVELGLIGWQISTISILQRSSAISDSQDHREAEVISAQNDIIIID